MVFEQQISPFSVPAVKQDAVLVIKVVFTVMREYRNMDNRIGKYVTSQRRKTLAIKSDNYLENVIFRVRYAELIST